MTIATAAVALRGRDETAAAWRSVIRNAETAQKQISTKFRSAFNLLGVGAAIFGITRAVTGAIKAGDDLAKFAQKSGMAAEAASELAHAAKMSDIELGSFATGIRTMQKTLSDAASGGKPALNLLKSLGLELADIQKLAPDQQFELLADQISRLKDPADRTRAAVELFGRAGADLLPLMMEGAQGIREARREAEQLGKSFSAADLRTLQEADDAIKRLKSSASSLGDTLALNTGPAITNFFDNLRIAMGGGTDREKLIESLEQSITALAGPGAQHNVEKLEQLRARLELVMNPRSDPLSGRGRVAKVGDVPPGFEWMKDVEKQAKLTKKELEELEKFKNQDVVGRQQEARLDAPLGPTMEENAAAISGYFREVNRDNIQLTERTIQLGDAFREADDGAKGLMATLRDESVRQGFTALSDVLYGLGDGMDNFAESALNAFRRILSNKLTEQIFELFSGLGSKGSGTGFLGVLASGIGALFGGGGGGGTPAGMVGGIDIGRALPKFYGGGFLEPGGVGIAGEGGKPELIFGGRHGATVVPMAKAGGGISVTYAPQIRIDSRADRAAVQQDVARMLAEHSRQFMRDLRDQMSRGTFD